MSEWRITDLENIAMAMWANLDILEDPDNPDGPCRKVSWEEWRDAARRTLDTAVEMDRFVA